MYAQNLKQVRKSLGLSVAKMALKLDMSASTLTGYEHHQRTPSVNLFTQLYKKLNVNLNWFISGEGDMFNLAKPKFISEKDDLLREIRKILREERIIR